MVPGPLGFAVFSPPLDRRGNSVRGTAVCEQLSQHFNLHVNRAHLSGPSVVRRSYRATTVRSKRDRGAVPTEALRRGGELIAVFELQGDLFFATAEALSRAVEPELGPALYLVLGCRRVGYIDHGAFEVLADLVALAQASGLVAVLAEASAMLENDMVPASIAALRSFGDLDSALEMALLDEGSRSSTAVADEDSVCRALSRHALTEMEHGPGSEIVPVLFKNLAKSLFRRLRETNEMVRALE